MSLNGKMFMPKIKGYHTEIIGDRAGNSYQIAVKDRVAKAKVFDVFCQAGDDPELKFNIDGVDAISRTQAMTVACSKYRYVMGLKPQVHVNCRIVEVRAKIGAKAA
jgi:hypothetical protein